MPVTPSLNAREVVKVFESFGWQASRTLLPLNPLQGRAFLRGIMGQEEGTMNSSTMEPTAEDVQHQATVQLYLDQIAEVNQAMVRDQQEIETLQSETRRMIADMQIILHKIEAR